MRLTPISPTNILCTLFVSLSPLILYAQQDAAETAQEVQSFVVKWFPLIVIIGLAIICIALAVVAMNLLDIFKSINRVSESINTASGNIEKLQASISLNLSEIKKALEEKQG